MSDSIKVPNRENSLLSLATLTFYVDSKRTSICHTDRSKIINLYNYFKRYCVLTNFEEDFCFKKYLGEGKYGKVYEVSKKNQEQTRSRGSSQFLQRHLPKDTNFAVKIYDKKILYDEDMEVST